MAEVPDNQHTDAELTAKETREIVTPYAFGVADELLGQPLASPLRRLLSQCIDLTIVVLLSSANALLLAFFVAITFFRAGKHLAEGEKKRGLARKSLRLSAACLLFLVTYVVVNSYNSAPNIPEIPRDSKYVAAGLAVAQKYAWKSCEQDMFCYLEVASGFAEAYGKTNEDATEVIARFDEFLADKDLEEEQMTALRDKYSETFIAARAGELSTTPAQIQQHIRTAIQQETGTTDESIDDLDIAEEFIASVASDEEEEPAVKIGLGKDNNTEKSTSLINWVDGVIKDLGLGLGWAALYYSVLTAWWRGHTIGKRVMRIKVVKLDGSSLNLWESFGRYGGYTAGLATGLLGFLQIFWDPNRQTIQDKIAETLVLYRPAGATPIPELVNPPTDNVSANA